MLMLAAIVGTVELNNNYIGLWKLRSRFGLPDVEELNYLLFDAADNLGKDEKIAFTHSTDCH